MVRCLDEVCKWTQWKRSSELAIDREMDEENTSKRAHALKELHESLETCERRIDKFNMEYGRALTTLLDIRRRGSVQIVNNGQVNIADKQINLTVEREVRKN